MLAQHIARYIDDIGEIANGTKGGRLIGLYPAMGVMINLNDIELYLS